MYGTMLAYNGCLVTWICTYLCAVSGHGDHFHGHHEYMYEPNFRDYHYDQYHVDHGRHDPPPMSDTAWVHHERPPPPKDRRPPPPRPPPTGNTISVLDLDLYLIYSYDVFELYFSYH